MPELSEETQTESSLAEELKPGWRVVRFDEMAQLVNDRVDNPAEAGVERYVGLEHLDPESLKIRRWGAPTDVEAQKLRFQPGDIIFGKRRAYQRKVAVADFEGICSAHAMVLRAREENVVKEFLPFFMQSDAFFDRALSISVGSLSPTINWKTLAGQKFALPPKDEQRRIADIIWAADEAVHSNENVVPQLQIIKSLCFETFLSDKRNLDTEAEENAELLENIRIERYNRWVDSQLAAFKQKGAMPADKDWRGNYREPKPIDASDLDLLPKGWYWVRAEQICEHITKGATPAKSKLSIDAIQIPFIKVYNLTVASR